MTYNVVVIHEASGQLVKLCDGRECDRDELNVKSAHVFEATGGDS
jgi:hypothetical protein